MKPDVVTGLFTLGGTAVGASLAPVLAGTQDSRNMRRAVRTAARLVEDEGESNLARLTATARVGRWLPLANHPLVFTEWEERKQALADWLAPADWVRVRWGVGQAQQIDRVHRLGNLDRPFSPMDGGHIEDAAEAMRDAMRILSGYSKAMLRSLPRKAVQGPR